MKGLITHEESQTVALAFRNDGHEFFSCDLQECSGSRTDIHIRLDCFLAADKDNYEFLGMHPVCKYLTNAGLKHLSRKQPFPGHDWSEKYQRYINWDRYALMKEAAEHFVKCLEYVKLTGRGYVENPIMHPYAMEIVGMKPTQVVQPWMFGHLEQKATCLWIFGLPPLKQTNNVYDEMMKLDYKDRAKVHYASPGPEREKNRSKTYIGIANAMADQWG
jgi:hypothetical protein